MIGCASAYSLTQCTVCPIEGVQRGQGGDDG